MTIGDRGLGRAELAPEIADVDIDDVGLGIVLVAPNRREDLLAGENAAAMAHQMDEQVELGARQSHLLSGAAHLAGDQVDLDVADAQRCRGGFCAARRSCARTRAASSASENGLTR